MNILREPLAELLAAAYVTGTLRGAARRRFERLMSVHPLLQGHVLRWQLRFDEMAPASDVVPPPAVWTRIAARLPGGAAPSPAVGRRKLRVPNWLWPSWAAVATAAALGLAVVAWPLRWDDPLGTTVAILQPADASAAAEVIVVTQPSLQAWQVIVPSRADSGPRHSWELWAVPEQGNPVSLGLAVPGRASAVRVPPDSLTLKALAVSLEPAGGSPTGVPTGPVRYLAPWRPAAPPG